MITYGSAFCRTSFFSKSLACLTKSFSFPVYRIDNCRADDFSFFGIDGSFPSVLPWVWETGRPVNWSPSWTREIPDDVRLLSWLGTMGTDLYESDLLWVSLSDSSHTFSVCGDSDDKSSVCDSCSIFINSLAPPLSSKTFSFIARGFSVTRKPFFVSHFATVFSVVFKSDVPSFKNSSIISFTSALQFSFLYLDSFCSFVTSSVISFGSFASAVIGIDLMWDSLVMWDCVTKSSDPLNCVDTRIWPDLQSSRSNQKLSWKLLLTARSTGRKTFPIGSSLPNLSQSISFISISLGPVSVRSNVTSWFQTGVRVLFTFLVFSVCVP